MLLTDRAVALISEFIRSFVYPENRGLENPQIKPLIKIKGISRID